MRREFAAYLYDLRNTAQAILDFPCGFDVAHYVGYEKTQAAVERKLTVIGEAFVQARYHFPDQVGVLGEVRGAIALRNVLIHEYIRITAEEIWRTVQTDVPALLARLKPLIEEDERLHG